MEKLKRIDENTPIGSKVIVVDGFAPDLKIAEFRGGHVRLGARGREGERRDLLPAGRVRVPGGAAVTALATAFTAAGAQSAAEIAQERRITDVIGAVALVLAMRALDESTGSEFTIRLGEVPRHIIGPAILAAIDSGASLDEATAAVIAAMEGD